MDPITLIVTAVALGAAAGFKATTAQIVIDAYTGLKAMIQQKYASVSLAPLEHAPDSLSRRALVAEDLQKTNAANDDALLRQAQEVIKMVRDLVPETLSDINLNLGDIKVMSDIEISHLQSAKRVSIAIQKAEAMEGGFKITNITAGDIPSVHPEEDPNSPKA